MNSYDVFENENEYTKARDDSMRSIRDKAMRRRAIRVFKEVYGSSLRKLLETCGWHNGEFLDCDIIQEQFEKYHLHDEVYKFLKCLIEAYNDNLEYKRRKTPVKRWKWRVCKQHFNSYLFLGSRELKKYRILFRADEQEIFRATREALLIYNTILRTFFLRKLPKSIPMKLYTACLEKERNFEKYYEAGDARAVLTTFGRHCETSLYGGFQNTFSDDVTWLFVKYFLRFDR